MKVGDIIRRAVHGKPVGPYLMVEVIDDEKVYAGVIGLDEPNIMLLKKDIYVPKMCSLPVSERVLLCLRDKKTVMIQHKATKQWLSVYDQEPELIKFYCLPKMYSNVYTIEYMKRFKSLSLREDTVRIVLNEMVL